MQCLEKQRMKEAHPVVIRVYSVLHDPIADKVNTILRKAESVH